MWRFNFIALINPFPPVVANNLTIRSVLNFVFGFIGALCLLMVTYGGFKFVLSQGDSGAVAKAKNTILYALVGMIVTLSAVVIVNFILGNVV